jgi:putative transposase
MDMHKPSAGHAALRRGRCSVPGHIYLLTFTTCARRQWFAQPRLAMPCCLAAHQLPDHWHGLLQLGEKTTLSAWVARCKSMTTRAMPPDIPRPLWARGFHDHAVRRDEDLLQIARYIIHNPVRAGLAVRCGHYPWWDAVWLGG